MHLPPCMMVINCMSVHITLSLWKWALDRTSLCNWRCNIPTGICIWICILLLIICSFQSANSVYSSNLHFTRQYILKSVGCTTMKFDAHAHAPQRVNLVNYGDFMTIPLPPLSGQNGSFAFNITKSNQWIAMMFYKCVHILQKKTHLDYGDCGDPMSFPVAPISGSSSLIVLSKLILCFDRVQWTVSILVSHRLSFSAILSPKCHLKSTGRIAM